VSARLPVAKLFPESASPDGGERLSKAWLDVLSDVPLLTDLSRRHLGKVASLGRIKRFPARTSIVTAGTNADAFYVILDGRATVRAGKRRIPLTTGDYFGEMALLDGGVRSASVVADSEMLLMAIPRRGFLKLLESEPKIAISIMGTLAHRVRSMQATSSNV
jgi:CRP/FNR family transcriptional regulator, cyclic AMP receptor protein